MTRNTQQKMDMRLCDVIDNWSSGHPQDWLANDSIMMVEKYDSMTKPCSVSLRDAAGKLPPPTTQEALGSYSCEEKI